MFHKVLKIVQEGSKWFKKVQNVSRMFKIVHEGLKTFLECLKWFKKV